MPTIRFVISSYDIASTDSAVSGNTGLTVTRFTNPRDIPESPYFKKKGRKGFQMKTGGGLTMGAGTILGSSGGASTVKYDTYTIEFPYYFQQSHSTIGKKVEVECIHLLHKKENTEIDHTERVQTVRTITQSTNTDNATPADPTDDKVEKTITTTQEQIVTTVFGDGSYHEIPATIHSTLVDMGHHFDDFLIYANTDYSANPKVFPITDNPMSIDLWCYTLDGKIIDIDPAKTIIVCEFKLTY